ncbi:MAG: hypothetical protein AAF585_18770, partial [Verrucomicrobiota bacterium]
MSTALILQLPGVFAPWTPISSEANGFATSSRYFFGFLRAKTPRKFALSAWLGCFRPGLAYLYKTTDYGQTWTSIVGNLPQSVHSFAHVILE